MASKVKKGFLYYIAWLLFIVLGLFCIFASILIFSPGKDVFGINFRYVSDNRTYTINKLTDGSDVLINNTPFSTINVNAGFTDVYVVRQSDYDNITFELNKKIVGFSNSDKINYAVNVTVSDGALNVNITEPQLSLGLATNASLTIICPKEQSFVGKTFNIATTSGDISFGSNEGYDVSVGKINATTKSGKVIFNKKTNISSGTASITSESNLIEVKSNLTILLDIKTNSSKIVIDSITGGLDITANELKVKAGKIGKDVKFSSKNGYIYIDELGNIQTKEYGNFTAEADKMHIANIIIGKMAGNISIPNGASSDITIDELYGIANIETTSGNVKVIKTYNDFRAKTQGGKVTVTQLSEKRTNIQTKSGTINANFTMIGLTTDLVSEKGNINVNLKDGLEAKINYSAKSKINISWITTALEKAGSVLLPNTLENTSNIFNITNLTSGSISINNGYIVE